MTDPRDEDPRQGTFHHYSDFVPATPDRKLPAWFWIMLGVLLLSIVGMSIARYAYAAEPHVITVYYKGADYDHVSRTHFVLGDVIYESRETCNVAITRVRVHLSGARLQCNPQR